MNEYLDRFTCAATRDLVSVGFSTRCFVFGLFLIPSTDMALSAQAISTATVTQPLVVTAYNLSFPMATQTRPVGPLPSNYLSVASVIGASSRIGAGEWTSPYMVPGGTGWRVYGDLEMDLTVQFPGLGAQLAASLSGQIRLHFRSPAPVSGLLYLVPDYTYYPFQAYSGDVTVDVDGNGVPDYAASTRSRQPVEIPITLDSTGRDVVCGLSMNATWSLIGNGVIDGQATAMWDVVFLPNAFGLERRHVGCVPIGFGRFPYGGWYGTWQLAIGCELASPSSPPIVVGFFLLGLAEQNAPWTTFPYCPLLVANPSLVTPTHTFSNWISLALPDVLIPPGLRFYCQGVYLDAQNQVITSDSIRTL